MSFEEKSAWIYAVIAVALPVVYFATRPRAAAADRGGRYRVPGPLLAAIGGASD